MKLTVTALCASLVCAHASASLKEVQGCAGIKSDSERLGCYDMAVGKVTKTTGTPGDWLLTEEANPIDDTKTSVLSLEAESGINRRGQRPLLVVRCRSNKTELWISWEDYLGSDQPEVTTRMGSSEAKTRPWSVSSTKTASFYPRSPIMALKRMMKVDQFVAQVTPYNETPITAIFNVRSLQSAIQPLRENCNW